MQSTNKYCFHISAASPFLLKMCDKDDDDHAIIIRNVFTLHTLGLPCLLSLVKKNSQF